jgi:hypothetical protein
MQIKVNKKKLPDTLWALLETAVNDSKLVEKNPGYQLAPGDTWHDAPDEEGGKCVVCMAGSVISCTLKVPRELTVTPDDFSEGLSSKLHAIDCMRTGDVEEAYEVLIGEGCHCEGCPGNKAEVAKSALAEASEAIKEAFDDKKDRATWPAYLKAAKILKAAGI